MKKRILKKYILTGGIALTILVLGLGVLEQTGYVFSGPYLVKGGTLAIEQALPNSDVFIDNKRVGKADAGGTATFKGIRPGDRTVIVSYVDTWPWVFDFTSTSGERVTLRPLQVAQEAVSTPLDDDSQLQAEEQFSSYREASRIDPLRHENIRVWVEGTKVFSQEGSQLREVFTSSNPIRNVFWFGDRNDVVIIAADRTVFALDIRESKVQNFQPIYTGVAPEAIVDPSNSKNIFLREAGQYFSISI